MRSCVVIGVLLVLGGCSLAQEISRTPRTAIEQMLLSQAAERALMQLSLPIPEGETVVVEASGLQTDRAHLRLVDEGRGVLDNGSWNLPYLRDLLAARLGEMGYRIRNDAMEARFLVRVMVQTWGTNQGVTFFGMPPVQSVLLPFALPELTLFREQDQLAYARIHLDIFETETGTLVRSTPWVSGKTYYNQFTLLFFIYFRSTDLIEAP